MRAIRRLERRFNKALVNLDTSVANTDADIENAKLSKDIATLEAWKVEQEQVLDVATTDIAAAKREAADIVEAKTVLEAQIAELTTSLEASAKSSGVAQNQLSELAAQKLAVEVALQQAISEAPKADGETEAMAAKLVDIEKTNVALQAELDVARAEQTSDGDTSNTAKELAALQAQREIDLAEVNVILKKLIPLVEAK